MAATYDLVVVGAGPAGSMAARAAAEGGLSVLLVDKRVEIGRPVRCAEYVPRLIQRLVSLPPSCIAQPINAMRTYLPSGQSDTVAAPGFVLHRALLDKHLAIQAVRAGAKLRVRSTALERTPRGLILRQGQHEEEIAAKVIIGADGACSRVGGWIGQSNGELLAAAQMELVNEKPGTETEIYFAPEYWQGYAWFFPKGATANVGVGVGGPEATLAEAGKILKLFLDRLQASGRIKRIQAVGHTAGFVPVGGILEGGAENILLAGDAAGCVHHLTGAGILFAVISGRLAGEFAAKSVQAGDLSLLSGYAEGCREAFGAVIARGLQARRRLVDGWSGDSAALEGLLRENWLYLASDQDGVRRGSSGD